MVKRVGQLMEEKEELQVSEMTLKYYGGRIKWRVLGNQLYFEIIQGSTQFLSVWITRVPFVLRLLF